MEPEAPDHESPVLRAPRSFLLDAAPLPADEPQQTESHRSAPAPRPELEGFTLMPPVSEVVQMRRRLPAGEMPTSERAPALREAALRASRAPAVEIIARLSSERTKLKNELVQTQRERDEAVRQLQPLRAKLAAYDEITEPFALTGSDGTDVIAQLRAELASRDSELEARDASHQELARLAVEKLRAERAELDARMNEVAAYRVALGERDEELATLRADLETREGELGTFKSDLEGYDSQFDAVRAEVIELRAALAARDEALAAHVCAAAPDEAAIQRDAAITEAHFAAEAARAESLAARAEADAQRAEAAGVRAEADAALAELAAVRAELAGRIEVQETRERIDQEAREADAAAIRAHAVEIEELRAALEVAGQCAHDAEIAALRAAFEERSAEVDGLRAALDAAAAPCGHDETIGALQAEIEAELARRTALFAEHAEANDELDRLRRHCAALEQDAVRAGALESDLHAASAALESRAKETAALAEKLANLEREHATLRTLAEAKPSVALEVRDERAARASRGLAIGFGNASFIENRSAPPRKQQPRRFDDLDGRARPYPALETRPQRTAARMEKALRRVDRKLAKLDRLIRSSQANRHSSTTAAPIAAPAVAPAPVAPALAAPAPIARPRTAGASMFKSGGGMLGALIQANLALRAGASDSTTETNEKRGNHS